jgi:hypothetical protein
MSRRQRRLSIDSITSRVMLMAVMEMTVFSVQRRMILMTVTT